ncbi:MAG: 3-dehydroquinate dehydratase [Rhodospirillaceae bacterium]|nr:MAG: 3-dehydroquinate dehydratase [Rhodospirillaceae bacterium]
MPKILFIHGPNLGRLGKRKPEIYGYETLAEITEKVEKAVKAKGCSLLAFQSNSEGDLIDFLEANLDAESAIVNPGALMMAGWSLYDALEAFPAPWVEVHLSNVWSREPFRHSSILSPLAKGVVAGFGTLGYLMAVQALIEEEPKT